ncbi:MAG: hypothetical protein U0791_26160 [Gemmataceae bacterium]
MSEDRLKAAARRLKLHRRSAAILWYLHSQILQQRTNRVRVSERELGELLFGHLPKWPRNWRRDLTETFDSLRVLHKANLYVSETGRLALASTPLLDRVDDSGSNCHDGCAMFESAGTHRHYTITIGQAFLGCLAGFAVERSESGEIRFDFNPDVRQAIKLAEDAARGRYGSSDEILGPKELLRRKRELEETIRKARAEAKKQHSARFNGIITLAFVPLVLGHQNGVMGTELRSLNRILREITRGKRTRAANRPDRAAVFRGNSVSGSKRGTTIVLAALDPDKEYVEFNGNGTNHGVGYRMETCVQRTFGSSKDKGQLRNRTKQYLASIGRLQERLGLIVVGVRNNVVYTLAQLQAMAASRSAADLNRLQRTCLRFYLPVDYLNRWRAIAAAGIVSPGSAAPTMGCKLVDLRTRLKTAGFTHTLLAKELGKDRTYITKVLSGQKPCSSALLVGIEKVLSDRKSGTESSDSVT